MGYENKPQMGIQQMKEAMAGLKEPVFETDGFFRAVFFRPKREDIFPTVQKVTERDTVKDTERDTVKDTGKESLILQDNEKKILEEIRKNPRITAEQLSKILHINLRNTKKYFANLKKKGLLRRIGADRGGYWEVVGNEK